MELRPGQKLHSAVCEAQVVVVRAPKGVTIDLRCGGAPLLLDGTAPEGALSLDASLGDGPVLGKRYANDELGLELLCTRTGSGALTADGQPIPMKGAKPLPASD
jgi:hypothetical protein